MTIQATPESGETPTVQTEQSPPSTPVVIAQRLLYPLLFSKAKTALVLGELFEIADKAVLDSIPEKIDQMHFHAIEYIHTLQESGFGYDSPEGDLDNLREYLQCNAKLNASIFTLIVCPEYLNALIALPKTYNRVCEFPGYHNLSMWEQLTLVREDKIKQLNWHHYLINVKGMTPPQPKSFCRKLTDAGYTIASHIGFFAYRIIGKTAQEADKIAAPQVAKKNQ